jgi:Domain of unknown function (DUF5658)
MAYANTKVTVGTAPIRQLFLSFVYLQMLDFLTTIAFLANGIREANPFVRLMLSLIPSPIAALLSVKLMALLLGVYCWRMRRERLLTYINVLFAALVAWNVIVLIMGARIE